MAVQEQPLGKAKQLFGDSTAATTNIATRRQDSIDSNGAIKPMKRVGGEATQTEPAKEEEQVEQSTEA